MPPYNLGDLKKNKKEELEIMKLAHEVYSIEDKYAFERKKFGIESVRIIAVALMTSIIALGATYILDRSKRSDEFKQEIRKELNDFQAQYAVADPVKQNQMACSIGSMDFPLDYGYALKIVTKFNIICSSHAAIQQHSDRATIDTTSIANKQLADKINSLDQQRTDLQVKQNAALTDSERAVIRKEYQKATAKLDEAINASPLTKDAVKSSDSVEASVKQIDSISNQLYTNPGEIIYKSQVSWFKEDYFLQFQDYRVLLQKLDKKKGIQIQVCKTTSAENCSSPLFNKEWVYLEKPFVFTDKDNGNKYRINLVAIDHAGKNPFKLAAYITFEQIKK